MRARPAKRPADSAGGPILIVEDEKDLVRVIRRGLEFDGYKVLSTGSAESAFKLVRESAPNSPALILLDIALPSMDGLTFLRLLREESRIPVILVSGRCTEVDRIIGLKAGADDFLAKPFSMGELIARVECVLRRNSRPAEKRRNPAAR